MAVDETIQDRVLIRERFACYSDAAFQCDVERYLDCWAEDGVRIGQGVEVRGKTALRAQWEQIWKPLDKLAFFTEPVILDVAGVRATARCYCREIFTLKSGAMRKIVGLYHDVLIRENGIWRFARREYELFMDEGESRPGI